MFPTFCFPDLFFPDLCLFLKINGPGFSIFCSFCIFFFLSPLSGALQHQRLMFAVWFPFRTAGVSDPSGVLQSTLTLLHVSLVLALELRCESSSGDHVNFSALGLIFQDIETKAPHHICFCCHFPLLSSRGLCLGTRETSQICSSHLVSFEERAQCNQRTATEGHLPVSCLLGQRLTWPLLVFGELEPSAC